LSTKLLKQPEVNIGTAGHVDHGKTTLIQALTGVWASKHSEELRRGITIRIGYADTAFYKCPKCPPPQCYSTSEKCPHCSSKGEFLRAVSFVDCPGHEVLMTTMLSGAAVMDGAVLVIAANENVPQPQTREHLAALQIIGIKNIVIAQNKVDLIPREKVLENYKQTSNFVKGTVAEDAPIIPISAQRNINIDALIEAFEKYIPTPKRDPTKPPRMFVVRSFDINKPGILADEISGGVIGGTILQGTFNVGDEIEISPGLRIEKSGKVTHASLKTEIISLHVGERSVKEARCGGLVGVGTKLDPSLTKADGLVGNVVGKAGALPLVLDQLKLEAHLFEQAIGTPELVKVDRIRANEPIVLNVGTSVTVGAVSSVKGDIIEATLKRSICVDTGARVAISRRIADRWRLIGYGSVIS
jgi:translation initiation factor 2 subunit 3